LSPRTKLFILTIFITVVLFLIWVILPLQVNLSYFIRGLGLIAVVIAIALWSLGARIRQK
jgi:hypothetical protein